MLEQISLRLTEEERTRAQALVAVLSGKPEFKAFSMTRAAVLRLAIVAGLEVLEQRYAADLSKAGKKKR